MEKTGMMKCRKDLWRLWLRLLHHVFWKETETGWLGMKDREWKDGAKRLLGEGDHWTGEKPLRGVCGRWGAQRVKNNRRGDWGQVKLQCVTWSAMPHKILCYGCFQKIIQHDSRVALLGCKLLKIFCISCNVYTLEDCIEKFWVLDTFAKLDLATLDLHSWVENLNGA